MKIVALEEEDERDAWPLAGGGGAVAGCTGTLRSSSFSSFNSLPGGQQGCVGAWDAFMGTK